MRFGLEETRLEGERDAAVRKIEAARSVLQCVYTCLTVEEPELTAEEVARALRRGGP